MRVTEKILGRYTYIEGAGWGKQTLQYYRKASFHIHTVQLGWEHCNIGVTMYGYFLGTGLVVKLKIKDRSVSTGI